MYYRTTFSGADVIDALQSRKVFTRRLAMGHVKEYRRIVCV